MKLFKTEEEKKKEEEEKLKKAEAEILNDKEFWGKVGHIHQGLSSFGLWGIRDNGKAKFMPTKFEIHDDKILIERNRNIIQLSQIKEIFQESSSEAIIILNNDTGIPIQGPNNGQGGRRELKAFVNVLNKLIEENNSINSIEQNERSEDKVDRLIKLGEMYNNGLLTDEEFALMKKQLLSEKNKELTITEKDSESTETKCENCGAEVSSEDTFCSECGTQINET